MMVGPRNHSSPFSPSGASVPSSRTNLASRLGSIGPIVPALVSHVSAKLKWEVGDVSVRPYPWVTTAFDPSLRNLLTTACVKSAPSGAAPEQISRTLYTG